MLGYYLDIKTCSNLFRVIGGHITQHIFPLLFVRAFQTMKCSVQSAFHFSKHLVGCFVFSVIVTERKKLEHVFMIIVKPSSTRFIGIGPTLVQSSAH
jgi:hypothetical protein